MGDVGRILSWHQMLALKSDVTTKMVGKVKETYFWKIRRNEKNLGFLSGGCGFEFWLYHLRSDIGQDTKFSEPQVSHL